MALQSHDEERKGTHYYELVEFEIFCVICYEI